MITIQEADNLISVAVFGEFTLADFKEFEEQVLYKSRDESKVDVLFDWRDMLDYTVDVAWEDIKFIRDFMIVFGLVSSVFDFLTFGTLLYLLKATEEQFRTGWFLESVMTELLIVPIIRTWRPFYQSRPSKPLLVSTVIVLAATLLLPYLQLARWLGFKPLPPTFLLAFAAITALYMIASEIVKKIFYRRHLPSK